MEIKTFQRCCCLAVRVPVLIMISQGTEKVVGRKN
ncbi:hypothetical protein PVAP13_6NG147500 [Panicum virgatum]|uniref:Uncharacterized protein n=1 Tax=Panicum virgatum TaxID=38727 RepID=A0A8T0R0N5_PANVG|nr:hypothetical protein PVAP13_6NG147500 [Panicum virgatum]